MSKLDISTKDKEPFKLIFNKDRSFEFHVMDPNVVSMFTEGARSLRQLHDNGAEDGRHNVSFGNKLFTIHSFGDNEHIGLDRKQYYNDGVIRGTLNDGVPADETTRQAMIATFKDVASKHHKNLKYYVDLAKPGSDEWTQELSKKSFRASQ